MTIRLNGQTSGYVELEAPATAGSNTLVLPTNNGSSGDYLQTDGSGTLSWAGIGDTGKILQVVQTVKTDTSSESVSSGGVSSVVMSASITPASTSNKILVMFSGVVAHSNVADTYVILHQGGSIVSGAVGATAGNRQRVSSRQPQTSNSTATNQSFTYLDSPGVTTELTYQIRLAHASGETRTVYVNYNGNGDADQSYVARAASFLTLMEVAG